MVQRSRLEAERVEAVSAVSPLKQYRCFLPDVPTSFLYPVLRRVLFYAPETPLRTAGVYPACISKPSSQVDHIPGPLAGLDIASPKSEYGQ